MGAKQPVQRELSSDQRQFDDACPPLSRGDSRTCMINSGKRRKTASVDQLKLPDHLHDFPDWAYEEDSWKALQEWNDRQTSRGKSLPMGHFCAKAHELVGFAFANFSMIRVASVVLYCVWHIISPHRRVWTTPLMLLVLLISVACVVGTEWKCMKFFIVPWKVHVKEGTRWDFACGLCQWLPAPAPTFFVSWLIWNFFQTSSAVIFKVTSIVQSLEIMLEPSSDHWSDRIIAGVILVALLAHDLRIVVCNTHIKCDMHPTEDKITYRECNRDNVCNEEERFCTASEYFGIRGSSSHYDFLIRYGRGMGMTSINAMSVEYPMCRLKLCAEKLSSTEEEEETKRLDLEGDADDKAHLRTMKTSELSKRAKDVGAVEKAIDDALDADDTKMTLVNLITALEVNTADRNMKLRMRCNQLAHMILEVAGPSTFFTTLFGTIPKLMLQVYTFHSLDYAERFDALHLLEVFSGFVQFLMADVLLVRNVYMAGITLSRMVPPKKPSKETPWADQKEYWQCVSGTGEFLRSMFWYLTLSASIFLIANFLFVQTLCDVTNVRSRWCLLS